MRSLVCVRACVYVLHNNFTPPWGYMQSTIDEQANTIRAEQKRRGEVVAGLHRGLNVAKAIRAQQTALVAALREHSRVNTDEVQTLEFKLYELSLIHI